LAVRTDIDIDWVASPRIITVLSPSTVISVQDLVDTCRAREMDPVWFAEDHLIDASGKEQIDTGVFVGITATLRNAQVSFEARTGPAWALCRISGGNIVAKDENGIYIDPRKHMDFTSIDIEKSTSAGLVSGSGGVTAEQCADAVWAKVMAPEPAGTYGAFLRTKVLTVAKFLGLK
jgi:hypothetical protein